MSPVGQTICKGLTVGVCLLLFGMLLEAGSREVVVQVDRLNLRSQPGTQGAPLRQLKRGSRLTILQSGPDWLKVRYGDTIGYVRNRGRYLDTSPALDRARDERESVDEELAVHRAALSDIEGNESELLERLDALNRNIQQTRRSAAALRRTIRKIEKRIAAAETERREVGYRIEEQEQHVTKRLVAL